MSDAGFERLEELFHLAQALPSPEREAFLREHCGDDADLRLELEEMLRADGGLLDVPVLERIGAEELQGRRAGRWRVGKQLGEGGLGVVYEAFASDTGEKAAIKYLRPGLDAGAFRRRFLKEQKILEALEHPHIARLLDGGVDEGERPYLVVEFVDGDPLDCYLTETKPGGTARLALFGQVCEAVSYLHGQRVAHGDLKPSNILVDSRGGVKLLDFGAARLLETRGQETTLARAFLTPHYASPEQRQGGGPSVRSDVYSLGVILGEAFPGADADMGAIRAVCCRTEPEARYGSVKELGADLARYAAGRRVQARGRDRRYRVERFLRRNAGWVGLAAAVAAGLVTGGVFAWREMRRSEVRLAEMRGVVSAVLKRGSGPVVSRGEERKALKARMETAIEELERAGEKGMEVELAAAWRRLGAARLEDGDTEGGLEALRKSFGLLEGRTDQGALESQAITLPLWALTAWSRRGNAEAWELAERALAVQAEYRRRTGKALAVENPYYRLALLAGEEWARRGNLEKARGLMEEALGAARRAKSEEHVGRVLVDLAAVEQRAGREALARRYCAEAEGLSPAAGRIESVCDANTPAKETIAALRARIAGIEGEMRQGRERYQVVRRVAELHFRLGLLLRREGRRAEARAEWESAAGQMGELLEQDPGNATLTAQLERTRRALAELAK
jgi:tetratricopeptide (TPR) repeat protein